MKLLLEVSSSSTNRSSKKLCEEPNSLQREYEESDSSQDVLLIKFKITNDNFGSARSTLLVNPSIPTESCYFEQRVMRINVLQSIVKSILKTKSSQQICNWFCLYEYIDVYFRWNKQPQLPTY